jgi:hypothetical protein
MTAECPYVVTVCDIDRYVNYKVVIRRRAFIRLADALLRIVVLSDYIRSQTVALLLLLLRDTQRKSAGKYHAAMYDSTI